MSLRLVVWNCNMRLHDKLEGLARLAPDVIVVPECACPEVLLRRVPQLTPTGILWAGRSPHKGLALLSFGGWRVTEERGRGRRGGTTIAARVEGRLPFRLVAMWTVPGAPESPGASLARWESFLSEGPAAIAGDFNDALVRVAPLVRRIETLGFHSAYHGAHRVLPGEENEPTLFLRRRDGLHGHRDLVFLDRTLSGALRRVTVGRREDWTRASDHAPVVAEIDTRGLIP